MQGAQSAKSGNERNISPCSRSSLEVRSACRQLHPHRRQRFPPLPHTADAGTIATGETLFGRFCSVCHGEAAVGGVVPDLRKSPYLPVDAWHNIVLDGILKSNGMAPFGTVLDRPKAAAIRAYVIHRANERICGKQTAPAGCEPRRRNRGQGTAAGAPPCAQCHAFNGVSDASGAFPRLASQSAFYLTEQRRAFSSGVRLNAIMSPIARALSEEDISDVTAYFARLKAPFLPLATATNATLLGQGEQLAKIGNEAKGVPGCSTCHNADGAGQPTTRADPNPNNSAAFTSLGEVPSGLDNGLILDSLSRMFADVKHGRDDLKRRARQPCRHRGMQALNVKKDAAKANWGVALGSSVRRLAKTKALPVYLQQPT